MEKEKTREVRQVKSKRYVQQTYNCLAAATSLLFVASILYVDSAWIVPFAYLSGSVFSTWHRLVTYVIYSKTRITSQELRETRDDHDPRFLCFRAMQLFGSVVGLVFQMTYFPGDTVPRAIANCAFWLCCVFFGCFSFYVEYRLQHFPRKVKDKIDVV